MFSLIDKRELTRDKDGRYVPKKEGEQVEVKEVAKAKGTTH